MIYLIIYLIGVVLAYGRINSIIYNMEDTQKYKNLFQLVWKEYSFTTFIVLLGDISFSWLCFLICLPFPAKPFLKFKNWK